ncbi:hypothetical protein AURDEDRAFT_168958 [Auricularia subglabra TFB-10046 SS5]|nr:hypothetical protein AURDEDRAFT_168958 [Auricularia subglabra TFB-10046 SS5]
MPQEPRTPSLNEIAAYKPGAPGAQQQRALLDDDVRQLVDILQADAGGQDPLFKGVKIVRTDTLGTVMEDPEPPADPAGDHAPALQGAAAAAADVPNAPPLPQAPAAAGQMPGERKSAPEARHRARAHRRHAGKRRARTATDIEDGEQGAGPSGEGQNAAAADGVAEGDT